MSITVPNVAIYFEKMLLLGAKWARWLDANPTLSFGLESQVWYYDGGRVFLQVADQLGDSWAGLPANQAPPLHPPSWYAANILDQYEKYALAMANFGPGYRLFPYGVTMSAWRYPDQPQHELTLRHLVKNSAYIKSGLAYLGKNGSRLWAPWCIRESAYVADTLLCYLAFTGEFHPLLHDAIWDCVVEDINEFFDPNGQTYLGKNVVRPSGSTMNYINNFMIGLALEPLTHYHDLTGDDAILPVIETTLDNFWEHCVEHEDPFTGEPSFAQYYNCNEINGAPPSHDLLPDGSPLLYTSSSLNQLVSPAFAWAWLATGNDKYLDWGDKFWSAGVVGAGKNCPSSVRSQDYTFMGKQFSQNYKWGPDYIRWRDKPSSTTDKINNLPQLPAKALEEVDSAPPYELEQEREYGDQPVSDGD